MVGCRLSNCQLLAIRQGTDKLHKKQLQGTKMVNVLVATSLSTRLITKLQAVSPLLHIEQHRAGEEPWTTGQTTHAEVIYLTRQPPHPEQAPNLRWMHVHWAGIDRLFEHPIWKSDVLITNSSGVHAPNIAQYLFAQILGWAHRVPEWYAMRDEKCWAEDARSKRFVPAEIYHQTIGILGYGSIGREVARLAKAFHMRVLATKANPQQPEDYGYTPAQTGDPQGVLVDELYPPTQTDVVARQADYLVITLPLTPATYHLINRDILCQMKPTAFLTNVGRGEIIDEAALVTALQEGWIAGAGLDVFEQEPLPATSPLWQLKNAILTPHISGLTPYYNERTTDIFAENLRRYLQNQPLLNLVNRTNGY